MKNKIKKMCLMSVMLLLSAVSTVALADMKECNPCYYKASPQSPLLKLNIQKERGRRNQMMYSLYLYKKNFLIKTYELFHFSPQFHIQANKIKFVDINNDGFLDVAVRLDANSGTDVAYWIYVPRIQELSYVGYYPELYNSEGKVYAIERNGSINFYHWQNGKLFSTDSSMY